MTKEEKERVIKIAAEWLNLNLTEFSQEEREFWIRDFIEYMDITV